MQQTHFLLRKPSTLNPKPKHTFCCPRRRMEWEACDWSSEARASEARTSEARASEARAHLRF